MKTLATLLLSTVCGFSAIAQVDTITNGGFERWGNTVPSGDTHTEPTNWYSDQSGGGFADLGPETCFQDATAHSGSYSVKVETESSIFAIVNGVVTTGVVNAPSTSKIDGYIGTINHSTATDIRRMTFNGRPDSLTGWYQYTPGSAAERGKVRAILHIGNYFDPEVTAGTTTYHPNPIDSQIASAIFLTDTPGTAVSTWTRFSVPFIYTTGLYASDSTPDFIMINVTSSANQTTTVSGSTLLLDDLGVVYNPVTCATVSGVAASSVMPTTATISWTAVSGSAGYVYAVDNNAAAPASGTFTTATSVSVSGLTPGTAYYAHVYDSCGVGSSSGWVTVPFTTLTNVGVNNVAADNFSIKAFPNPVGDQLTINITGAAGNDGEVTLMDISGRIINTVSSNAGTVNMSMSGFASGIYFVRYIDAAHTQTIKVTKQ